MSELNKDTLQNPASQETPVSSETQVEAQQATSSASEKLYAGKYKSVDELEKSYKSLETKVGSKTYAETLGQKVVESTGYSLDQLQNLGYTPEQIVEAVVSYQDTGKQNVVEKKHELPAPDTTNLNWKYQTLEFYQDNPEAKEFRDLIEEFHNIDKTKSPQQIFEDRVKPIFSRVAEKTLAKQSEKEKASLSISNNSIPDKDPAQDALSSYHKTGHIDDATEFVAARLFGKK